MDNKQVILMNINEEELGELINGCLETYWRTIMGQFFLPFDPGFLDWDNRKNVEAKALIAKKAYNGIEWLNCDRGIYNPKTPQEAKRAYDVYRPLTEFRNTFIWEARSTIYFGYNENDRGASDCGRVYVRYLNQKEGFYHLALFGKEELFDTLKRAIRFHNDVYGGKLQSASETVYECSDKLVSKGDFVGKYADYLSSLNLVETAVPSWEGKIIFPEESDKDTPAEATLPALYSYSLNHGPFVAISQGKKRIEMRLYDEKRKLLKIGDYISFSDKENSEGACLCEVTSLHIAKNFEDLYAFFPDKTILGYARNEKANPNDMLAYYSKDKIKAFGVVGIGVKPLRRN
jgi:ASC-1-like (ASCH) protein